MLLQHHQAEQSRVASDLARVRARLAELEGDFDRMQRQMRSLATTSVTLCEVTVQSP